MTMTNDTRLAPREAQSLAGGEAQSTLVPPCDVFENDAEVLVVADLPGVTPDALQINVERGELSLSARRDASSAQGSLARAEYREASFARRFSVPDSIDTAKISAELKDGVLKLHLPKSDAVRPRQIPVNAG
jgi:HSP20 family protein